VNTPKEDADMVFKEIIPNRFKNKHEFIEYISIKIVSNYDPSNIGKVDKYVNYLDKE